LICRADVLPVRANRAEGALLPLTFAFFV